MIGIGIIGGGRICGAHASAATALPQTRLAAIAEVDPERLAQQTERWGCKGYADYREMLQDPEVQAVIICLPHFLHKDVTVDCLQAGRHVLLEKPMAMTTEECDAMIAARDAAGKVLMVAHTHHFFPVNLKARRIIQDGGIGNLVLATDTWYKAFWDGQRPAWFLEAEKGGGMWPMNGSHMIDRLTFFTGSEVVAVKAKIGSPFFGLSATDMGVAYLDFANGVPATIMHAGFREGVNRFEAEITGTEGQLRFSGDNGGGKTLWISRERRWDEITVEPPVLPAKPGTEAPAPGIGTEVHEFALSILEGREPAVTAEYGRQIVRVLEACEESSRTGREVRL